MEAEYPPIGSPIQRGQRVRPPAWRRLFSRQVLGMLPLLIWFFMLGASDVSERPGIDQEEALLDPAWLPTAFGRDAQRIDGIDWQFGGYHALSGENGSWHARRSAEASWTNGGVSGTTPELSEMIFRYMSPITAAWYFRQAAPATVFNFPSVEALARRTQPIEVPPRYHSQSADEMRVVCAVGGADSCQAWYAWLRYGQYIMQLRLISQEQSISSASFTEILRIADRAIIDHFAGLIEEYPNPTDSFLSVMHGAELIFLAGLYLWLARRGSLGRRLLGRIWPGHWNDPDDRQRALRAVRGLSAGIATLGAALLAVEPLRAANLDPGVPLGLYLGLFIIGCVVLLIAANEAAPLPQLGPPAASDVAEDAA